MKRVGFIETPQQEATSVKTVILTASADYIGKTEYENVINNLTDILGNTGLATHSAWECYNTARNPRHCVKSLLGVSNSEGTQFKACYKNNCLGIMKNGQIKSYESIKASITDRVSKYNKYRYNLKTPQERLTRSKYCTSECKYRVSNFNYGIKDFIYK